MCPNLNKPKLDSSSFATVLTCSGKLQNAIFIWTCCGTGTWNSSTIWKGMDAATSRAANSVRDGTTPSHQLAGMRDVKLFKTGFLLL